MSALPGMAVKSAGKRSTAYPTDPFAPSTSTIETCSNECRVCRSTQGGIRCGRIVASRKVVCARDLTRSHREGFSTRQGASLD